MTREEGPVRSVPHAGKHEALDPVAHLGQEDSVDLRAVLRDGAFGGSLDLALEEAMRIKPKGHDFVIERRRDGN